MSKCRYGTQIKGEYGTRPILCALQNGARCEDWPPDRCWRYQCAAKGAAEAERDKWRRDAEGLALPLRLSQRYLSAGAWGGPGARGKLHGQYCSCTCCQALRVHDAAVKEAKGEDDAVGVVKEEGAGRSGTPGLGEEGEGQ